MDKTLLDLYSDYLLSSYVATQATRLSDLLQGAISHDKITRFLAEDVRKSRDLWNIVKPHVRAVESADGVLIIDDSIEENPTRMRTILFAGIMIIAAVVKSKELIL